MENHTRALWKVSSTRVGDNLSLTSHSSSSPISKHIRQIDRRLPVDYYLRFTNAVYPRIPFVETPPLSLSSFSLSRRFDETTISDDPTHPLLHILLTTPPPVTTERPYFHTLDSSYPSRTSLNTSTPLAHGPGRSCRPRREERLNLRRRVGEERSFISYPSFTALRPTKI